MSFPRYESYKDSGIEWLGEVPEHWECLAVWLSGCYSNSVEAELLAMKKFWIIQEISLFIHLRQITMEKWEG